jgi:L-threonylcarbamoyladenylate synthase
MQVFELNPEAPEPDLAGEIAALLRDGKVVAYPTDTLYGLGANAFDYDAVHRIVILKGREGTKPFPYIIDKRERLGEWEISLNPLAETIVEEFWPGPVSLVVQGPGKLPGHVLGSKGTVCVRAPRGKIARALAASAGGLLVATSANPAGLPPSRSAREAIEYFRGEIDAVVDGGPSESGLPSTIVDVSEGKIVILREGAVPSEKIFSALAGAQKKRRL